jgi:dienelactone hydrolase
VSRAFVGVLTVAALLGCVHSSASAPRHVVYLHGRIIQEQQNARPVHPEHGPYELKGIVNALQSRGFKVSSSIRPKAITVSEAADVAVAQVRELLETGVRADHITVMGASMGSTIAWRVAARLQNPDVRFVMLGPCASVSFPAVTEEEGKSPAGRILVIREESDVPSSDCAAWNADHPANPVLRELIIETGLGHGFLYRPLPEWLDPATDWVRSDR